MGWFILLNRIQVELDDKLKPKHTLHIKNLLVAISSGYNIIEMADTYLRLNFLYVACATIMAHVPPYIYVHTAPAQIYNTPDNVSLTLFARQQSQFNFHRHMALQFCHSRASSFSVFISKLFVVTFPILFDWIVKFKKDLK